MSHLMPCPFFSKDDFLELWKNDRLYRIHRRKAKQESNEKDIKFERKKWREELVLHRHMSVINKQGMLNTTAERKL